MDITITKHALDQIESRQEGRAFSREGTFLGVVRQVVTVDHVEAAVTQHLKRIQKSKAPEVRLVVRTFKAEVLCSDGSNGDVVLACIDPQTVTVKTVMLQRSGQVLHKIQTDKTAEYIA